MDYEKKLRDKILMLLGVWCSNQSNIMFLNFSSPFVEVKYEVVNVTILLGNGYKKFVLQKNVSEKDGGCSHMAKTIHLRTI